MAEGSDPRRFASKSKKFMKSKLIFVSPGDDEWRVKRANVGRAAGTFPKQAQAIERAIEIAKNNRLELAVQGRDGRIRIKNSYGRDSFPPRG